MYQDTSIIQHHEVLFASALLGDHQWSGSICCTDHHLIIHRIVSFVLCYRTVNQLGCTPTNVPAQ